jgi:hypothetical protein
VACRRAIDPAEIRRPREAVLASAHAAVTEPKPEQVRYPWGIFFAVLGIAFFIGMVFAILILFGVLKQDQAQLVMQGVSAVVAVWVFFDALRRRIPRPMRWALGTMLLLAVIFPWYLARRSKPRSSVPFVEAEVGPVTRFLIFALLIFFLVSLIFYIVQGPQPAKAPVPHPGNTRTVAIPKPAYPDYALLGWAMTNAFAARCDKNTCAEGTLECGSSSYRLPPSVHTANGLRLTN